MNLQNLNDVLKYGRAPIESVREFARQALEVDRGFLSGSGGWLRPEHATGVLADYLDDHDDPRSAIVRRQTEHRQEALNNNEASFKARERYLGNLLEHADFDPDSETQNPNIKSTGWVRHKYPDGTALEHNTFTNRDNGKKAVHVRWEVPVSGDTHRYYAAMTPDELSHVLNVE
jgi:hypothetical protein